MKKVFFLFAAIVFFTLNASAQDSTAFSDFYGKYKFAEGSPVSEVEIVWLDNAINISSDMGNALLTKTGVDSFSMDYMGGIILFSRDSTTHKVSGLTILVSGMEMIAVREESTATGALRIKSFMKKEEPVASK